ncbi:NAD(P)-dependent oxidoreductase [Nakamurella endophytica]|uniref:3-hydroxyisobutyrate dehydrogenase n=1 Tax=Nakamurella endophytica TaxID=1748367 RepID=A0A917SUS9_9ACTN|nr:NAD(P)-dependent oxidoreductase [Nakamurella endophytica]GGL99690.1 3-hydroxyisobutyrate dehydrogenase [Nakamurella endophytica]
MTSVAVLGTGVMGVGMARSLLRDGFDVTVWNRTRGRAEPLADDGATVADSAGDAVAAADAVVLMLFDAPAVLDVLAQVADRLRPEAVVLQASTIGPAGMAAVGRAAADAGVRLLDAPVLGTRKPAADGKLVVLASGDPELRAAAQPVFDAIGSRTVWVGDELGLASALKLACNSWVASINAAGAQALALARAAGLDPQLVLDSLGGGPSDSPYLQLKGGQMVAGSFEPPSFALDGVRKDLELMQSMATSTGVSDALLAAVRARYDAAAEAGHGGQDMAAVISGF